MRWAPISTGLKTATASPFADPQMANTNLFDFSLIAAMLVYLALLSALGLLDPAG